jgi:hypothetical protein
MSISKIEDHVCYSNDRGRPLGDVFIRPFDGTGKPLKSPFSVFANKRAAEEVCLSNKDSRRVFDDHGIIVLGDNLVVNSGRQIIANLIGGRNFSSATPNKDWVVSKISFGTYDEAPRFTDTTLSPQYSEGLYSGGENEIAYDGMNYKKLLSSVDWPQPFIIRFEGILGVEEATGFLIRELGLWSYNETLFARKAIPAISKDDQFGFSILWRVRV